MTSRHNIMTTCQSVFILHLEFIMVESLIEQLPKIVAEGKKVVTDSNFLSHKQPKQIKKKD